MEQENKEKWDNLFHHNGTHMKQVLTIYVNTVVVIGIKWKKYEIERNVKTLKTLKRS